MTRGRPLEDRFLEHLRSLGVGRDPTHLLVAVSGGCDSVVLLFLLRFYARHLPLTLTVAHLDHAMRPGSDADARWLRGLCAAWQLPLVVERLPAAPAGEAAARRARYEFLRRTALRLGADLVATAHHADDQAETVLFRILRGTGLSGLVGIRPLSAGLLRPLLPFWRREIERFARRHALRWRADPTNRSLGPARNRLRHEVLPLVERSLAPAARRNLLSLSALALEAEAALEQAAERAEHQVVRREGEALLLARGRLRDYDSATGSRILRNLLRRFGVVLSRTGTRAALQFITDAASGRELHLPGGLRVRVEFDVARIERGEEPAADEPLLIPALPPGGEGSGRVRVGGRGYLARYRVGPWPREIPAPVREWEAVLPHGALRFPLQLRGWEPGDRMRTTAGSKALKKLFVEHRVPRSLRRGLPVLVDAAGTVLWAAGVPRGAVLASGTSEHALFLTLLHD